MQNKAIITGITGQDGSYLADLLLSKNYTVIGCYRRSSTNSFSRIKHLLHNPHLQLIEFDLTDPSGCNQLISTIKPQEFYNLAAQSHVATSFQQPSTTFEINTLGLTNILESMRLFSPSTKLYQASTSEMFGRNYSLNDSGDIKYQNEQTTMLPQSPYGIAKLAGHHMIEVYRAAYHIFATSGILFNHESPKRGENFVTRKITKWIGEFLKWKGDHEIEFRNEEIYKSKIGDPNHSLMFPKLRLGNLDAFRDWGYAGDYVEAMWLMLQQEQPDDYVICTGETHTIREFLNAAFDCIGISNWSDYVIQDPQFYRPAEVDYLRGDNTKAKNILGWEPKTSFETLVHMMVEGDIKNAS
jgi:GDPmannose 4,6-dehydratase